MFRTLLQQEFQDENRLRMRILYSVQCTVNIQNISLQFQAHRMVLCIRNRVVLRLHNFQVKLEVLQALEMHIVIWICVDKSVQFH